MLNPFEMKLPLQDMPIRYALTIVFVATMISRALAQQDPAYSFYMYNGLAVNPAVSGSAETFSATAIYRHQWAGIEGAPETFALNLDAPIANKKLALGLSIVNDKIGVTDNLNINGLYAYRLRFENATLSLGLQAGLNNYHADYTSVRTDNNTSIDDQSFSENTNRMIFNFGSGVYYYNERFYAGFSVPHIINQKLDGIQDTNGAQARQYRHYYINTGYVFSVGLDYKIKPSVLMKVAEGAPVQLDFNSNFWYKETVSLGLSFRTNDSFSTLIQFQMKKLRIGYAHDFITSSLSRYTRGNNEVMIRYELFKGSKKILTPRYF
jgi:type IX secretion system PorP/SprF family membrane protein